MPGVGFSKQIEARSPRSSRFEPPKKAMQIVRAKTKSLVGSVRSIYVGYGLVHLTRPIALLCYSFVGALVFLYFERQAEIDRGQDRSANLRTARHALIGRMLADVFNDTERFLLFVDGSQTVWIAEIYERAFTDYERTVLRTYSEGTRRMQWDLGNALVYSWTVITTIGYGHLCPSTVGGRIATMIFAIFGIPLMLSILTDVGKLLTRFMKYPFLVAKMCARRIFQYCTRMTREEILEADEKDKSTLEVFDLPIPIAIGTVVGWIFICSAITLSWEKEWDYLVAFYFFFISLSTIGFGDVVPSDTRYLFLLFGNIMIGLALVSMCINLMQTKLEKLNAEAAAASASSLAAAIDQDSRPKEMIVDLMEESIRADEPSSFLTYVRGGTPIVEEPPPVAGRRTSLKCAEGAGSLLEHPAKNRNANESALRWQKAFNVKINHGFVTSKHSFPSKDTPERTAAAAADRAMEVPSALRPPEPPEALGRPIEDRFSDLSSDVNSAIGPADIAAQFDHLEEYRLVLTKKELIDQMRHENLLTKLA